ncbi:MAG: phosphatidate cytidylyltransferase [Desulfobacteraceae bacterium 4572_130]|nr:MAG: phosphatidate cytidylyltransferase [Desulfobacteraceae bacterium 4572_130]
MHLKRWLTSLVLIPLLFLILLKGTTLLFSAFVSVITLIAMTEYFTIISCSGKIPLKIKIIGLLTCLGIIASAHVGSFGIIMGILTFYIIVISIIILGNFSLESSILDIVAKQIQGIIYIPVFLSFFVFIRNSENGIIWIIWIWLIIASSDTGAYYYGTFFGKKPLLPNISPNKTIEGAIGGIVASLIAGLIFSSIFIPEIFIINRIIFILIACIAGQIGDLFESALKRAGKIKDSGNILPGHGGILDRLDGLIFALPITYFFKYLV